MFSLHSFKNFMDNITKTIFVNKPLDFNKIKAIGFSLEHVIIQYTVDFYELIYNLVIKQLCEQKYPEQIKQLKYIHQVFSSVSAVDKITGSLLCVDEFGNIIQCTHGKYKLTKLEIQQLYPEKAIKFDNNRFFIPNCDLDQIQIQLYSQLVELFENEFQKITDPIVPNTQQPIPLNYYNVEGRLNFYNIFNDINKIFSILLVDRNDILSEVLKDTSKYWKIPKNLVKTLQKLKQSKLVFIQSSQKIKYVLEVLKFALGDNCFNYLDYVFVCQSRSSFFNMAKPFRKYYPDANSVGVGSVGDKLEKGCIYINGCIKEFEKLTKIASKHTLYCSERFIDNEEIYKSGQWHFCQIIPRLNYELQILKTNISLFQEIDSLKQREQQILMHYNSEDIDPPQELLQLYYDINEKAKLLQNVFGQYGSQFMTSWSLTKTGAKLCQYCDLYTTGIGNFSYYAPFTMFSVCCQNRFLPHQIAEMMSEEIGVDIQSCRSTQYDEQLPVQMQQYIKPVINQITSNTGQWFQ